MKIRTKVKGTSVKTTLNPACSLCTTSGKSRGVIASGGLRMIQAATRKIVNQFLDAFTKHFLQISASWAGTVLLPSSV